MKLSILVPLFNEAATIAELLHKVDAVAIPGGKEIIVVDDGSADNSWSIVQTLQLNSPLKLLKHEVNQGKGAAIKTALAAAAGDYVIVQDADLEYDPTDIARLMNHLENNKLKVIFGSRNLQKNNYQYWHYYIGGKSLTWIYNLLYRQNLTDHATGYKLLHTDLIRDFNLQEDRFGFCAEVAAKLALRRENIVEIPISYQARTFAEGKKIKINDGANALWIFVKYFITRRQS